MNTTASRGNLSAYSKWKTVGALSLGVVFLVTGVSKLVSIAAFQGAVDAIVSQALASSTLPLATVRQVVSIATPGVEVCLGGALIVYCRRPRIPAAMSALLLVAFSGLLGLLLTMDQPPSCGCLGSWEVFRTGAKEGAVIGLFRNAGLLILAVWLVAEGGSVVPPRGRVAGGRAGFTLIEMLVVSAIIAGLIAILLPALSLAKRAGKTTGVLSAVQQSLTAIAQYSDSEAGFLPYLATPEHPEFGVFPEGEWEYGPPSYFRGQASLWPTALLDHGIDLSGLQSFSRPEHGPERISTYVWLSHAAVSRPEYWEGIDPPESPRMFSGVRFDEAVFPSAKGLLSYVGWTNAEANTVTGWEVGMCDGSASVRSMADPPLKVDGPYRKYGAIDWRVLTTWGGIRGRDY